MSDVDIDLTTNVTGTTKDVGDGGQKKSVKYGGVRGPEIEKRNVI